MELLLAQPRGFCAGVARAVEIVERALALHGAPVYVFHEIVHNGRVVGDLERRGAVFVETIEEIPRGAVTIFSAHGVSNQVRAQAGTRGLRVIDATCPMVTKVHTQAQRYARLSHEIIMIGHPGHEEVEGTMGSVSGPVHLVATVADVGALAIAADARVAYVTQTTLSVEDTREIIDALRRRWPHISGPELDDICFATQNRQVAVRTLAQQVDVVLVLGAHNSSNSNRLREVARNCGRPAYLLEDAAQLDPRWLVGRPRIGVTAGASVPESLVTELCDRVRLLGATAPREMPGEHENVVFRLPDLTLTQSQASSTAGAASRHDRLDDRRSAHTWPAHTY
jgi:4-hydroxy-3-methylbut-2-enyl diphosphate reductase